jgi:hypothetical protein
VAIRKRADLKNLQELDYLQIDNSPNSNGYYEIVDFPEKLTAGKNLFKIRMQNDRFVNGSEVYIEVLDFNGNPIYMEPIRYLEKDGTRVVSIYIYPETSPGTATIFIAGRIRVNEQGAEIPFSNDPADKEYFQNPNFLWARRIPVAPFADNTTEIIYTKQPSVTITEIIQPYRQPVEIFNIFTEVSSSNSTYTVTSTPTTTATTSKGSTSTTEKGTISGENKTSGQTNTSDAAGQGQFQGALSKKSPNKSVGQQTSNQTATKNTLQKSSGGKTTSEAVQTMSGTSRITIQNLPLSKSMEGGTLTVVNPLINVLAGTRLKNGLALPSTQRVEFNSVAASNQQVPLSGSYTFQIMTVLTSKVATVAQIGGFKNDNDNTFGAFAVELDDTPITNAIADSKNSGKNQTSPSPTTYIVDRIEDLSTNITASFIKPSDVIFTENSSSFADIIVADTEPSTGDVYKMKTLFKPSGFFGDFIDLGDTILEQQNILVDTASLETNITIGSFYENFGVFESLQEINQYWSGSVKGNLSANAFSLAYDTDTLIGGAHITPTWQDSSGISKKALSTDAVVFEIQNKYRPEIVRGTTYVVRFSVALPTDIRAYSSTSADLSFPRLDVYTNNDVVVENPLKIATIGDVTAQLSSAIHSSYSSLVFADGGELGTRVGTVLAAKIPGAITTVELQFKALSTGPLDLKFVTRTGAFIIADIEVLADKETGYTPGYVRISKRIPTEHLKTPLTFKFQYFDIAGRKAEVETFAYGAVFNGGNIYIDGTDNLITGSVFIGSAISSGVELAGVSSGFLRSVGYEGSKKAAAGTGPGGFLLYSGSSALNIGDNSYTGVGLDLVGDGDNSHLIFTTSGSGFLDIKAEKFFIGTNDTQFISGSDGNIEISSSLFHLDPQENLLIIGADAVINADLTVNSLRTPALINGSPSTTLNASSSIDQDGFAKFASASIAGFEVVTDEIRSANESLRLKASGDITASKVLLEGGTITAGVTIQGSLSANSILTPATIGGSPSTPQNASSSISDQGLAIFRSASIAGFVVNTEEIKSSNQSLRLKANGQITGSNVLFSGGTIGGFDLLSNELKSSNNNLKLKDSGQITGSTVLFTGGRIGGFTLSSNILSATDFELNPSGKRITLGSGNNIFIADGDEGIQLGNSTFNSAPFSVTKAGALKAVSGEVGGFTLSSDKITGNNIVIDSAGSIQTADYASDLKGWKISSDFNGFAEFENAKIRGTLATAVFEKETVNAVGGQLYVANSTALTASSAKPSGNYLPTDTTMSVVNVSGFSPDEILSLKKVSNTGFSTEYVKVISASRNDQGSDTDLSGELFLTRGYGNTFPAGPSASLGDTPGGAQSYSGSQVIVSTGKIGTGFIRLNANPNNLATPYMDIVERTGSGVYDVELKVRLGDLKGLANSSYVFGSSTPGFGLATDNVFLQGGIIANTGSIAGIEMEAGKLYIGAGNHANSDTGFYVDSGSNFSLGDKLTWNGSALVVRGQLRLESGQTVDQAINEATASNTAKSLILTTDSQVMTFASASAVNAVPNKIIFSVAQQNLTGSISASNVTITTNQSTSVTNFAFDTGSITTNSAGLFSGIVSGSFTFTGNLNAGGLASDKDNFPVSINVAGDGFTDQTTVFKLEGGSTGSDGSDGAAGTDGTDAITTFLTNESHTFPAAADGTVSSFLGGSTDMIVFQGITNVTNNFVISASNGIGVSSSLSSNTVSIGSLANDSGSVKITATSESVSLDKTMSLAKSKTGVSGSDGSAGSSAKLITLTTDSQVFSFPSASSSNAIDNDILFIINQQNLDSAVINSNISIIDSNGSALTVPSLDTDVTSGTGQVSGSITFSGTLGGDKTKLPLTLQVSRDSVSDTTRIFKLEGGSAGTSGSDGTDGTDGVSAVTAFLTNESHTFPAASDGTISSFVGGSTNIVVFEGLTNKSANYSVSASNSLGISSSIDSGTVSIGAMAHDSGSVKITAQSGSGGTQVTLDKTMSLAKSRAGISGSDGSAGANAKTLTLTSDSQIFSFASASSNVALDNDILFIINQQNLSGTIGASDINISTAGGNVTNFTLDNNDVTAGTGIVSGSITFTGSLNVGGLNSNKSNLPTTITVTKDGLSDTTRIFKIDGGTAGVSGSDGSDGTDGQPSVNGFLTNESHTFVADQNGTVTSFGEGSSSMFVFVGLTNSTGSFSYSRANSTGVSSTLGGPAGNVLAISAMAHDSGSIDVTATSASINITKTMTLAKSRQGASGSDGSAGANAKTLTLTSDSQIFSFASASSNVALDNDILFIINQQNLSGTISTGDINISTAGGVPTTITNFLLDNNSVTSGTGIVSGSLTFSGATNAGGLNSTKSNLPVTITVTKDSLTDTTRIFKIDGGTAGVSGSDGAAGANGVDGQPSVNGFLTNESHTFVSDQNGNISSFTEGSSSMFVFVGLTNSTGSFSYSRTNSSGVTSTLGGPAGNVLAISGMTHDSGSINVTATSASISITKTMTLAKSRQGASGSDGSAGAPGATGPIGPNFDFLSGSLSTIDTTGGLNPGLIMTSNVFGFHGAISEGDGTNATLGDFTSFLDGGGSFYLGGGASGSSTPDGGYFAWNNGEKSLLISGSKAEVKVDKFFVGNKQSAFLSGSNGNIEISSSKFHVKPDGDVIVRKVTADEGTIGGFGISSNAISSSNNNLILRDSGQITGSNVLFSGGKITGGVTIEGSVTANAIRTPATIGGSPSTTSNASSSIDSSGFAKFVSASIGGFVVDTDTIRGGNEIVAVAASSSISYTTVSASLQADGTAEAQNVSVDSFTTNASTGATFWADLRTAGVVMGIRAGVSSLFMNALGTTAGTVSISSGPVNSGTMNINLLGGNNGTAFVNSEGGFSNQAFLLSTGTGGTLTAQSASTIYHPEIPAIPAPLVLRENGEITASAGLIGGFSLSTSSISTTGIKISDSSQPLFISSSNFKVDHDGDIEASDGTFTGVAIANIIRDKSVTVTAANSGSYLEIVAAQNPGTPNSVDGYYKLVLDGSLGGEKVRRAKIDCAFPTKFEAGGSGGTTYQLAIAGLVLPSISAGSSLECVLEVGTDGVFVRDDVGPFAAGKLL